MTEETETFIIEELIPSSECNEITTCEGLGPTTEVIVPAASISTYVLPDKVTHGGNRDDVWNDEQTNRLIMAVKENYHLITEKSMKKGPFFKCITKLLHPLIPSITSRQVENKWKNLTYRFSRYEDNRLNNLGMKLKEPIGYELMASFVDQWGHNSCMKNVNHQDGNEDVMMADYFDVGQNRCIKEEKSGEYYNPFLNNDSENQDPETVEDYLHLQDDPMSDTERIVETKNHSPFWTEEGTNILIRLIKPNYDIISQRGTAKKKAVFQQITNELRSMMPFLTWQQVFNKWKNTRNRFYLYNAGNQKKKPVGYNLLCTFLPMDQFPVKEEESGSREDWGNDDNVDGAQSRLGRDGGEMNMTSEGSHEVKRIKIESTEQSPSISQSWTWSKDATLQLLSLLKEDFEMFQEKSLKRMPMFSKISTILRQSGFNVSPKQVEIKIKNLRQNYLRYERSRMSGIKIKKPFCYSILNSLFKDQILPVGPSDNNSDVTIDISEFLTINSPGTDQTKMNHTIVNKDYINNKVNVTSCYRNNPQINKLVSIVESNTYAIEKKLNDVYSMQEKILEAIQTKNELLRKLLDER